MTIDRKKQVENTIKSLIEEGLWKPMTQQQTKSNVILDALPQLVDSTMMNTFKSCHQKFHLSHHLGYRPKGVSIDLHAGARFADALHEIRKRVFGKGQTLAEALLYAHAKFMQDWGDIEPPPWKPIKTRDRTWRAVTDYFEMYKPLTDHVQPFFNTNNEPSLEYTFSIPLEPTSRLPHKGHFPLHPTTQEPFLYGGRFDLLGHMSGKTVAVDEKTTSGIGTKWADQWNLRSQFIGYIWALNQVGIDADTAVIRGVAILTSETKFAEAIRPYSRFVVDRWYEQLRRDLWAMVRCWEGGYWDFDLGEACTAYGNCSFLDVCQSPNPANWLSDFEIRHWSPLSSSPDPIPATPTHTR